MSYARFSKAPPQLAGSRPPGRGASGIPPGITVEMAKGFTLFMMKAVLSGRGDDLIDLAEANLWQ